MKYRSCTSYTRLSVPYLAYFFFLCERLWKGCGKTLFSKKVFPQSYQNTLPNEKADLVYKSAFCVVRKLSILLNVQNLLSIIEATNLAYAVILNECITCRVGALVHAGQGELAIVRASLVSASGRYFFLRYCHVYTSS